jgi:hypothetical protein
MVGVQSSKVRLWGGVLYVLKSGNITCSGEVLQGDWTPCEDNIVLKNWPILYFLDKRLAN